MWLNNLPSAFAWEALKHQGMKAASWSEVESLLNFALLCVWFKWYNFIMDYTNKSHAQALTNGNCYDSQWSN